jgi:hypothetical protein
MNGFTSWPSYTQWPFLRYDMWPHRQDDSCRGQVYTRCDGHSPRGVMHGNTNTTHVPARCKRDGLSRGVMCGNTKSTRAEYGHAYSFPAWRKSRRSNDETHTRASQALGSGSARPCTLHADQALCLYTVACLPATPFNTRIAAGIHSGIAHGHCI